MTSYSYMTLIEPVTAWFSIYAPTVLNLLVEWFDAPWTNTSCDIDLLVIENVARR